MTQLNLSDEDVVRLLHSLSSAKYKILNKEPNTKTISPTDYFEFNSKFTDASIVRIMKSQKVLGHQQLVMECVEQLDRMFSIQSSQNSVKFMQPDFKAIKNRIEDLITQDYLQCDKDNPYMYRDGYAFRRTEGPVNQHQQLDRLEKALKAGSENDGTNRHCS